MVQEIVRRAEHVFLYEDKNLQAQALAVIPVEGLTAKANAKMGSVNNNKFSLQDFLLLELLYWFKSSFFSWVDCPKCESCGGATVKQGMIPPTPEELQWGGNRVENYKCSTCSRCTKFVRYNHPGKLLQTRRGRCGEWANCFTLCCRALGMEARYVLDWTDHVWTEVYSCKKPRLTSL